jgi:RimJ/RimL family protein N-acetyltransferase
MVELRGSNFVLRPWRESDVEDLARIANNKKISKNLMIRFSYPFGMEDAKSWVGLMMEDEQADKNFVVEVDGRFVGGVGFELKDGLREGIADGGYWLGEEFWGRGIASEAWRMLRDYVFENYDIRKFQAGVFSWNPASVRVQEKCGFKREAVLKKGIIRFGEVCDEFRYGLLREEWEKIK